MKIYDQIDCYNNWLILNEKISNFNFEKKKKIEY